MSLILLVFPLDLTLKYFSKNPNQSKSLVSLFLIIFLFMHTATTYIKYFGYVQFGGVFAAPLCSLLFRGNFNEKLNAGEDFAKKVKILILPGFVFVLLLILLDALQLMTNIHLSVSIKIYSLFSKINKVK